jgi:hypothetical protein
MSLFIFFFFNDTATTEIYTRSHTPFLPDPLPIYPHLGDGLSTVDGLVQQLGGDRARPRRIAPKRSRLSLRLPRLALDTVLDALEERAWRINIR